MLSHLPKQICKIKFSILLNLKNEVHLWSSKRVREAFISFYKEKDHKFIPSIPVIPWNDSSIEFVNAGMNQFKSSLLGHRGFPAHRVVNSQKCIRVGGKHNDLSDVGRDTYHHTFFEMLGNWSFNNYFKEEACKMSWELLTTVFKIPQQHLYVTYFGGDKLLGIEADEEVKNIWLSIGVPKERVIPFGMKENFWEMGNIGPCGISTEIHYEREPSANGASIVNKNSEDLIELWNLVFIQYQRLANGKLVPLKNNFVDTGMGLERITACLNGKRSNYDTDLFMPLFDEIAKLSKMESYKGTFNSTGDCLDTYYRILADHSRMAAFSLTDGLLPHDSVVLRKIIRKSFLLGWEKFHLRNKNNFMGDLLTVIRDSLGDVYPELNTNFYKAKNLLEFEEHLLAESREQLSKDWPKLTKLHPQLLGITNLSPNLAKALEEYLLPKIDNWTKEFSPEDALKLVEKYALSEGAIEETVETLGLNLNLEQFHSLLKENKISKKLQSKSQLNDTKIISMLKEKNVPETIDRRYDYSIIPILGYSFSVNSSHVQSIIVDNSLVEELKVGQFASLVLDSTMFYPTSGGQTCDKGILESDENKFSVSKVEQLGNYVLHSGQVIKGIFRNGSQVFSHINREQRLQATKLHTSHHLLRAAVEYVAGMAYQRSSDISSKKLTLKLFVHPSLTAEQVLHAEKIVKSWIRYSIAVSNDTMPLSDALRIPNITLLSGEKYPDDVHVVKSEFKLENDLRISTPFSESPIPKIKSVELCCGTHVFNAGDIDQFAITELNFLGNGITHIEAVCGTEAAWLNENGTIIMSEFHDWEQRITSALINNEILKYLHNDFKKWKSELNKSRIPASAYCVIEEKSTELINRMKDVLLPKSNWKELQEEFAAHVVTNPLGPILYEMNTEYRGSLDDLLPVIKEVSGRPAIFVCRGWGRIRTCVYIPQSLQDETVNVNSVLNSIKDEVQIENSGIKCFSDEIGTFHINGVKKDQIHSIKSAILKSCKGILGGLIT